MHVRSVRAALTASPLVALVVALYLALYVAGAPSAQAGGPTSALLSVPGAGETASLYYTDPEYDELGRLVGMGRTAQTFDPERGGAGHETGVGVTITWLIHDVEPWRVDRIYLDGQGGPWIATQASMGGSLWEAPVVWHQPAEGKRLIQLLGELGLTEPATGPGPSSGGDLGSSVAPTEPVANSPVTVREQPAPATWRTNASWAAAGLAGGALLALGCVQVRRRREGAPVEGVAVAVAEPRTEILAR